MAKSKPFDWSAPHDDEEIVPRDVRFGIGDNPQLDWFGGDPVKTALIDSFSIFLPEGERFFIRSLKHYASRLDDPELAAEINGYAVQEAFHTREHEEYNRALEDMGFDVKSMEEPIAKLLGSVNVPLIRLAVTCAIEHLTANFSSVTLRHPEVFDGASPAYRRLWMWHALEELEHKAVALDIYRRAASGMPAWKRYGLRVGAMTTTVRFFHAIASRNMRRMLVQRGFKDNLRLRFRVFWAMFLGSPGIIRRSLGAFLRYYLPGFDPRNVDDTDLIRSGRAWLAAEFASDGPRAEPAE